MHTFVKDVKLSMFDEVSDFEYGRKSVSNAVSSATSVKHKNSIDKLPYTGKKTFDAKPSDLRVSKQSL